MTIACQSDLRNSTRAPRAIPRTESPACTATPVLLRNQGPDDGNFSLPAWGASHNCGSSSRIANRRKPGVIRQLGVALASRAGLTDRARRMPDITHPSAI
jgi:hypothetical protein